MAYATNLEVSIPMELRKRLRRGTGRRKERHPVLDTAWFLLLAAWLVGLAAGATAGGLIHFLPVLALVVIGVRLTGRRSAF